MYVRKVVMGEDASFFVMCHMSDIESFAFGTKLYNAYPIYFPGKNYLIYLQ